MLDSHGSKLSYGQILTRLCGGTAIVGGSLLLFAVAFVLAEAVTRIISGSGFNEMPEFVLLIKQLAVILSFAIGSKYAARWLGAALKPWLLWVSFLMVLNAILGWLSGITFEALDAAIIIGVSAVVFAVDWLFMTFEQKKG